MTLSNKAYDILKWFAQILLPALATLYFALAKIWGFPFGEEVVGTISAVDIFLGALLGLSSKNYVPSMDGTLHITPDNEVYAAIETPTQETIDRGTITLAVKPVSEVPNE